MSTTYKNSSLIQQHRDALFLVENSASEEKEEDFLFDALHNNWLWTVATPLHRINIVSCCKGAEHGWIGASLSCLEILLALHVEFGKKSSLFAEDTVILSKGHAAAAQYAVLYSTQQHKSEKKNRKNSLLVSLEMLTQYKNGGGKEGETTQPQQQQAQQPHLEAHADIHCDTGSLGQGLSVAAGMAAANPSKNFAIVLGDGELQEGQNYEALMSIKRHQLYKNLLILVDRNGFQSENLCQELMPVHSLETVCRGFGFSTITVEKGNDVAALSEAIRTVTTATAKEAGGFGCSVIIANTSKCSGTALMQPATHPVTGMAYQPWHTKVPDWPTYVRFVDEQLAQAKAAAEQTLDATAAKVQRRLFELCQRWESHKSAKDLLGQCAHLPNSHRPAFKSTELGTGAAFGKTLVRLLQHHHQQQQQQTSSASAPNRKIAIVSADLASSCGINDAVHHEHFYEMGVAEQDAVSFAGGLALSGGEGEGSLLLLPVVCTYGVFFKRAMENIFINLVSNAHCIYAGHYSGLCYHTDGKSHQSLNDVSLFLALPSITVVDPLSPLHAEHALLSAVAGSSSSSFYFRLRRTPAPKLDQLVAARAVEMMRDGPFAPLQLQSWNVDPNAECNNNKNRTVVLVMGPVAAAAALEALDSIHNNKKSNGSDLDTEYHLVAIPALRTQQPVSIPSDEEWAEKVFGAGCCCCPDVLVTVEDEFGALKNASCAAVCRLLSRKLSGRAPTVTAHKTIEKAAGPSCRTLDACLEYFDFTAAAIEKTIRDAVVASH